MATEQNESGGAETSGERPVFSVVTPAWNRRDCVRECIDSVLNQDFDDWEMIVVDDGSTDGTDEVVESYEDPRIRLIRQPENRGVCAARHVGTAAAAGQWIISLDTDWQLKPGAMQKLAEMARNAPADVGVIGGCAMTDEGERWPTNDPPAEPFGLAERIRWTEQSPATDFIPCRRREVFDDVQWPTDRRLEGLFHLRVASRWRMWISPDILGGVYTKAPNRWTTDRSGTAADRKLAMAPLLADDANTILGDFGKLLRQNAPRRYWNTLFAAATYNFLAGQWWMGTRWALRAWAGKPWRLDLPALCLAALLGPRRLLRLAHALR